MKILLLIFFTLTVSACSTAKFDKNVNCSPRALNFLNNEIHDGPNDIKLGEDNINKSFNATKEIMTNISSDLHKCYQDSLDKGFVEQYNVCVVLKLDEKGKILFLDVDDHNKTINLELQNCFVKKLESTDFSKLKNKTTTVVQPYNLYPSRK